MLGLSNYDQDHLADVPGPLVPQLVGIDTALGYYSRGVIL